MMFHHMYRHPIYLLPLLMHNFKKIHINLQVMVMLFIALLLVAMKSTAMSTSFVNFEKKTRNLCVRNITQSADGLMWLTAEDGLYSFDGYHLVRHSFFLLTLIFSDLCTFCTTECPIISINTYSSGA